MRLDLGARSSLTDIPQVIDHRAEQLRSARLQIAVDRVERRLDVALRFLTVEKFCIDNPKKLWIQLERLGNDFAVGEETPPITSICASGVAA